jgi:hypothetical protein
MAVERKFFESCEKISKNQQVDKKIVYFLYLAQLLLKVALTMKQKEKHD